MSPESWLNRKLPKASGALHNKVSQRARAANQVSNFKIPFDPVVSDPPQSGQSQ